MLRRHLILALSLVLLSGCASIQADVSQGQADLTSLTRADLERGLAIATAAHDVPAVACSEALLQAIGDRPRLLVPAGVYSTFLLAREARRGVQAGIPESVHMACASLVVDAETTLVRLGIRLTPGASVLGGLR